MSTRHSLLTESFRMLKENKGISWKMVWEHFFVRARLLERKAEGPLSLDVVA